MTDPKPYTTEEARDLARLEQGVPGSVRAVAKVGAIRLLATAQAAAEADSLRAQLVEARNALGLLTTLAPEVVVDAEHPLEMAHEIARSVEAALSAAQAEVAVLRAQIDELKKGSK